MADSPIAEVWCVVECNPAYSVSNRGRVRRDKPGRGTACCVLKNSKDRNGYAVVNLHDAGVQTKHYVHRLVALAFLGSPPEGKHIAHWDGNGMNADVRNIRWATQSENEADKIRHGRTKRGFSRAKSRSHLSNRDGSRVA